MLDRVYCGILRAHHAGEKVALFGWVAKRRDHGGVVFVDLRDKSGVTQVVFRPEEEKAFANAHELRNEYVLHVIGGSKKASRYGKCQSRHRRNRSHRRSAGDIESL